jgi:monoterpene epsilon-lactone hydrolase
MHHSERGAVPRSRTAESITGRPALVAGDSAGGGLALSLRIRLRELGEPSPRGAALLSPWVNLSEAAVAGPHLSGLAALLVLVGQDEALAEETRRLVARAGASRTNARLLVGEGMQHDWPLTLPWPAEIRRAWKAIAAFIEERACPRALEGDES